METEFTNLPQRINQFELIESLAALGVQAVFDPGTTWTVVAEDGTERFRTDPPTLRAKLPNDVTREQVQAVISNHKPHKTDAELRSDQENATREARKAELRVYLLDFLSDPELLGLLRAALAGGPGQRTP